MSHVDKKYTLINMFQIIHCITVYVRVHIFSKNINFRIFLAVQDTVGDWMPNYDPNDDPARKGKKDTAETQKILIYKKRAGPTSTQVNRILEIFLMKFVLFENAIN